MIKGYPYLGVLMLAFIWSCNAETPEDLNAAYGTYHGDLPCANCAGVSTTLSLTPDSFFLTLAYVGAKKKHLKEYSGTYTWKKNYTVVKLDVEDAHRFYKVEESFLRQLDTRGRIIGGTLSDYYILKKTN